MGSTAFTTWAPVAAITLVAVGWSVRAARRTPNLWRTKLAVGLLVVAVALTCFTWGDWSTYVTTKDWTTTKATVLDAETRTTTSPEIQLHRRSVTRGGGQSSTSMVEVTYTADGQEETWVGALDGWHYPDEVIQIRHDPDNPKDIVEVTATSDVVTPAWESTNNTVSSIGGMQTYALVALGAWIVTIPVVAILFITWLVSRRRQTSTVVQGAVQQGNVEQLQAYLPPFGPSAWHQPLNPSQPGIPGQQAREQPWSSRSVPQQYPPPTYRDE